MLNKQSLKGLCMNKSEEQLFLLTYDLSDPKNAQAMI